MKTIVREVFISNILMAATAITIFAVGFIRLTLEEENRNLEKKLGLSMKMELIGRVAGSVAHDLNNILGGIINFPELIERIFEPFFATKVMGWSGSGLALPVAWGIVKDHDGFVDVTSSPDAGTTISVYLPACGETDPDQVESDLQSGQDTLDISFPPQSGRDGSGPI